MYGKFMTNFLSIEDKAYHELTVKMLKQSAVSFSKMQGYNS